MIVPETTVEQSSDESPLEEQSLRRALLIVQEGLKHNVTRKKASFQAVLDILDRGSDDPEQWEDVDVPHDIPWDTVQNTSNRKFPPEFRESAVMLYDAIDNAQHGARTRFLRLLNLSLATVRSWKNKPTKQKTASPENQLQKEIECLQQSNTILEQALDAMTQERDAACEELKHRAKVSSRSTPTDTVQDQTDVNSPEHKAMMAEVAEALESLQPAIASVQNTALTRSTDLLLSIARSGALDESKDHGVQRELPKGMDREKQRETVETIVDNLSGLAEIFDLLPDDSPERVLAQRALDQAQASKEHLETLSETEQEEEKPHQWAKYAAANEDPSLLDHQEVTKRQELMDALSPLFCIPQVSWPHMLRELPDNATAKKWVITRAEKLTSRYRLDDERERLLIRFGKGLMVDAVLASEQASFEEDFGRYLDTHMEEKAASLKEEQGTHLEEGARQKRFFYLIQRTLCLPCTDYKSALDTALDHFIDLAHSRSDDHEEGRKMLKKALEYYDPRSKIDIRGYLNEYLDMSIGPRKSKSSRSHTHKPTKKDNENGNDPTPKEQDPRKKQFIGLMGSRFGIHGDSYEDILKKATEQFMNFVHARCSTSDLEHGKQILKEALERYDPRKDQRLQPYLNDYLDMYLGERMA